MQKILLLLFLFSFAFAEECIRCEDIASITPTKMFIIADETKYLLQIYLYNASSNAPLINTPIIIHRYNTTDSFFEKTFTNQKGIATYNFSSYKDSCFSYQILFCSCNDTQVRKCCFELNNININKPGVPYTISSISLAKNAYNPPDADIIYNYHAFPATELYSYCKPKTEISVTPAFCLPLAIIFALLGGSLMLTGRNPLRGFDIGGARVGKHIRYDSRGRYAAYGVTQAFFSLQSAFAAKSEPKTVGEKVSQLTTPLKDTPKTAKATISAMFKEAKEAGGSKQAVSPLTLVGMIKVTTKDLFFNKNGEFGKGILTKAAIQMVEKPFTLVTQFGATQRIGAGQPGGGIVIKEEGEKKGGSPIFDFLAMISGGTVNLAGARGSFENFRAKLITNIEMEAQRIKAENAFNATKEAAAGLKVTQTLKDGSKVEVEVERKRESVEGKEIEVDGRKIVIKGMKSDGTVIYEEKGQLKVSFTNDSDNEKINKKISELNNELDKKNASIVGVVAISIKDEKYFVTKDAANNIIVLNNKNERVTDNESVVKIKEYYNEIISQKSDFELGAKNSNLEKYDKNLAYYHHAAQQLKAMDFAFLRSEIESIKEKQKEIVMQNITKEDFVAADKIVANGLKEIIKDEKGQNSIEKYADVSKRFADISSVDYVAQKLGIREEQLTKEIKEGNYKNIKEYVAAQKDALAYAEQKQILTQEQINMQTKINSYLKEYNLAENQLEKSCKDVSKIVEKNIEIVSNQLRNGSATNIYEAFDIKEKLEAANKYFNMQKNDPYNKVDALSYAKDYWSISTFGKNKIKDEISFQSDKGFTVTGHLDLTGQISTYLRDDGKVQYFVAKDTSTVYAAEKYIETKKDLFSKIHNEEGLISGYSLFDKDTKSHYIITETEEGGEKKIIINKVSKDGSWEQLGPATAKAMAIEKKYKEVIPDEYKIGADYWTKVKDEDLAQNIRNEIIATAQAPTFTEKTKLLDSYDSYLKRVEDVSTVALYNDYPSGSYSSILENVDSLNAFLKNVKTNDPKDYETLIDGANNMLDAIKKYIEQKREMGEKKIILPGTDSESKFV